ncbi:MAG TPA: TetR/AcrR family transcriptional regulator [Mycobacteriales bacterium]|nr:TetR/AcrR family transcriptional regulator [Mycobacteriales bacterium]
MRTAAFSDRAEPVGRSYAGRSAAERDAQRRARLLAGARQVIGSEGYAATTVEKICGRAGVSTRHFYLLYATKEDAFVDLYRELTAESYRRAVEAFAGSTGRPMAERVPEAFVAYLEPMFTDLPVARIAFVEVMGVSPRLEEVRLAYRESLIEFIQTEGAAAVRRRELADRDFRFAALALIGAANAIVYDWVSRPKPPTDREMRRALAKLAITLLVADPRRAS